MLRCAEFVEQVTTVEECVAGRWLALRFQLHRLACSHCRRYLRQMRAVLGAMARLPAGARSGEPEHTRRTQGA